VGRIYRSLPLYDMEDPDGPVAVYLTALDFVMGVYLTEQELNAMRRPDSVMLS
jgi:hypothetical protein